MWYFITLFLSMAIILNASNPLTNKIIEVNFEKNKKNEYLNILDKRDIHDTLSLVLKNEIEFYAATLELGTPPQNITVLFDTGSSDLWVSASTNPYCLTNINNHVILRNHTDIIPSIDCNIFGTFNVEKSSTLKRTGDLFNIKYAGGNYAEGFWGTDELMINGKNLTGMKFAVAEITNSFVGVLGIGFKRLESIMGYKGSPGKYYDNFPLMLKNNGLIKKVAYSLYLNNPHYQTGVVLFGGVDLNKYVGNLYTYPMVNIYPFLDKPAKFHITLQGIGVKRQADCFQKTLTTTKWPALLDSGTTLIVAPKEIADSMASVVNATFSQEEGIYILDCPSEHDSTKFYFDFGKLKIEVPLSSFILNPDGHDYCGFGVLPSDNTLILGDVFLSSAYVVYNLEDYEISLAQAHWGANSNNIKAIETNVPGARPDDVAPWSTYESIRVTSNIFSQPFSECKTKDTNSVTPSTKTSDITTTLSFTGIATYTSFSKS